MEAREGQKETYLKWKDGIHLWVVMTTGGQCEWAWVTQNSILRTQTQVWMESHSTCSWCPAWVLWHPSPALVHLSPRCSLMVHTSNLLWKQQKLPPSPPMRTLVHTHTHTHRTAGGHSLINAGKRRGQKPSSLTSTQDQRNGTILFLSSLLDPAEARQLLKPHPCSSPCLLFPSPAALTLFK